MTNHPNTTVPSRFRFRAWDEKTKTMLPVVILNIEDNIVQAKRITSRGTSFSGTYAIEEFTLKDVMQSTGLTDKNGREIFEGDICKASKPNSYLDGVYEVAWHESKGQWYYKGQPSYKPLYQVGCAGNLHCEVIGNIYQNPELLPSSDQ